MKHINVEDNNDKIRFHTIIDELTRLNLEKTLAGNKFSVEKYIKIRLKELNSKADNAS